MPQAGPIAAQRSFHQTAREAGGVPRDQALWRHLLGRSAVPDHLRRERVKSMEKMGAGAVREPSGG